MNLSQIEYFAKAAETLSFSRAADELFVTQQAVSKAVANLEVELGVRLFERQTGGLVLTPVGQRVQLHARGVLREVTLLAQETRKPEEERVLRLAVADAVLGDRYSLSLQSVLDFRLECPDVRLEITEGTSDACLAMIDEGVADIAVVSGRPCTNGLLVRRLDEQPAVVFASPEHPLAARSRVDPRELAEETFLIPRGSTASADEVCAALYAVGADVPDRSQFVFPDCTPRLLIERVSRGEGLGLIRAVHADLLGERCVVLPLDPNPFVMRLSVVTRRPLEPDGALARLRAHLLRLFVG